MIIFTVLGMVAAALISLGVLSVIWEALIDIFTDSGKLRDQIHVLQSRVAQLEAELDATVKRKDKKNNRKVMPVIT